MGLKVGDVVTLAIPMLGCNPGSRGVVINTYEDFDQHVSAMGDPDKVGVQVIFENGEYDGFSVEEQGIYFNEEQVEYVPFYVLDYKFTNVMKVTEDFNNGFWDEIFEK